MKTFKVTVDGQSYTVQVEEMSNNTEKTILDKTGPAKDIATVSNTKTNTAQAAAYANKQPKEAPGISIGNGMTVKAPMPGSVIEVKVKEGDAVKDGDVLLVLEAMKMENELTASKSGTIAQILVKKGDTVNSGDPLIIIS